MTLEEVLAWLEQKSTKKDREGLARYGITAKQPFGVSMAKLKVLARRIGRDHELAAALWATGRYEARMLTALIDDPALVTRAQMDRWCRDFDSWALCDTLCFHLFDRTPHAWAMVSKWSTHRDEFVKRAAFALLASLGGHDKQAGNPMFLDGLRLIERAATDDRNYVKKAVSWALRRIGGRNTALHRASVALARRLAASTDPTPRWIGKDALRDITRPVVLRKLAA